jgi:hypothetical protein
MTTQKLNTEFKKKEQPPYFSGGGVF